MADETKTCRNAIVALIEEIKAAGGSVTRVWKVKPPGISTSCEVVVATRVIGQGQAGTQTNMEDPTFDLVAYAPLGGYHTDPEDRLLDFWSAMVAKSIAHVSLDDTCERHTLSRARLGQRRVAGKPCRTLTATIRPQIVSSQTYL